MTKMGIIKIKGEFIGRIRRDDTLKLKVAKAHKVKVSSIERWLRSNNVMLTTATTLEILKDHFGLIETTELLEEKVESGAK